MTDKLMDTESVLERMAEAIDGCGYEIYDLSRPKAKAALAASGLLEEVGRLRAVLKGAYGCMCHFQHDANPDRELIQNEIDLVKQALAPAALTPGAEGDFQQPTEG